MGMEGWRRRGRGGDLRDLADEELMALVAAGQPDAFDVIYERHSTVAFSLAYRICGTRAQAEDVLQEAFMSIWRAGGRYDQRRGSVRTWLLSVVHHRAVDALRRSVVHDRRRSSDETAAERLEAGERTELEAGRRAEAEEVRAVLRELPPEQIRVIQLAYYGGFTQSEIAEMLDTPLGTIKGRMRLGLRKLRDALEEKEASA
jgi:RNA polymerase sigma-70 factor (ECF subfamily)